jgi:hypothetical protein
LHPHFSRSGDDHLIARLGSILQIASGAKINSGRCEYIGGPAIFGVTRQLHLNDTTISASVLCEIRDLHEMIARHDDYKSRIVARNDLALERVCKDNRCGSNKKRSDDKSHGEHFHDLTDKRDLHFGYQEIDVAVTVSFLVIAAGRTS